jgi:hypothetical protein
MTALSTIVVEQPSAELTEREAKAELLDMLANGQRFMVMGQCDNFDPNIGCKGHEE